MVKVKKRRKSSRFRGSQTAFRGAKERTRGSGNQGGKGMSGTGKRGDQIKTLVIQMTGGNNYFGRDKALRRGNKAPRLQVINISDIEIREATLEKKEGYINLEGYKILGDGEITRPLKIRAGAASPSAKEKIESAGGELMIDGDEKKEEKEIKETPKKTVKKEVKENTNKIEVKAKAK